MQNYLHENYVNWSLLKKNCFSKCYIIGKHGTCPAYIDNSGFIRQSLQRVQYMQSGL
jgi:hypothetical protein